MDLKDKRILYELSKNSRAPAKQIAKKVGLSKDAVIYRIKNLEKAKIIQKYITIIDLERLGYRTHTLFLEFKRFDLKEERQILDYLTNSPHTIWVSSPNGKWDVIIDIISKDTEQFDETLREILGHLGKNMKNYEISETVKEFYYNHRYLSGKDEKEKTKRTIKHNPSEIDYQIMKELSQNSRIKNNQVAEKLKISQDQVAYRIRKLLQAGYIKQFTILIDFSKLSLSYYFLFFQFSSLTSSKEKELIDFLKSQKEVLFLSKIAGRYNFNVDAIVENSLKLKEFIVKLRSLFGDILESRETFLMFEQKKNDYFPKILLEKLN